MLPTARTLALLGLLASCAAAAPAALHEDSPLHGRVERFEVVRLAASRAPAAASAASPHPSELGLAFEAFGARHSLSLARNERLLGPDYREVHVGPDGAVLRVDERRPANCYYRDAASRAALSTCDGVSGFFHAGPELGTLVVEPARRHLKGGAAHPDDHVVYRAAEHSNAKRADGWCASGHGAAAGHAHAEHAHAKAAGAPARRVVRPQADLLDRMLVYSDKARIDALQGQTSADSLALVNAASVYYQDAAENVGFNDDVTLQVAAQIHWVNGDPIEATVHTGGVTDIEELLELFQDDVADNSTRTAGVAFDSAYLLSGFQLGVNDGGEVSFGTVGLASVGAMCSGKRSSGVVETIDQFSAEFHAVTLAHELGHNFGMEHDTGSCATPTAGEAGIMSTTSDGANPPTSFTDCSATYFNEHLSFAGNRSCLEDSAPAVSTELCGNGIVEGDEECDCGDRTCNCCTAGCEFVGAAVCSDFDGCCNATSCQPLTAETVCRAASNAACDVAETCDGTSGQCPPDFFKGGGVSCGTDGACFGGECVEPLAECVARGEPAVCPFAVADAINQPSDANPTFDFCARLACRTATQSGRDCQVFTAGVPDGMPCAGAGDPSKQCFESKCVSAAEANAGALLAVGIGNVSATLGNASECVCNEQTFELVGCFDSDGRQVPDAVCEPLELTKACESEDVSGCPGLCTDDEIDVPQLGCTANNTVYAAAGGAAVLLLICLYCCCCRSEKPKVDSHPKGEVPMRQYN